MLSSSKSPLYSWLIFLVLVPVAIVYGYYPSHPPLNLQRQQCNLVRQVALGEKLRFRGFPPQPIPYQLQRYGPAFYEDGFYRARECTWEFGTNDECVLEFVATHFDRGDVDCEQQYFLVGDENHENRYCGLTKPPANFTSSGRRLFLTHFARNGYKETVVSSFGGVVQCVKPSCVQPKQTCIKVPAFDCQIHGAHTICFDHFEISGAFSNSTGRQVCSGSDSEICQVGGQMCFASVPVNQTCNAALPPVPPSDGDCTLLQIPCPQPGTCSVNGTYFTGANTRMQSLTCAVDSFQQCTLQATFCISKRPFP